MHALLSSLRAAAEPTRLRLLAILSRADLTVSELTRILGQSQPRISRHLKLMCDAGLLERSQEGAWAFYRVKDQGTGSATARAVLSLLPASTPDLAADLARLEEVKHEHAAAAAQYFRDHAQQWDLVRKVYAGDARMERAIVRRVGEAPVGDLLDLGTGTGYVLRLLAQHITRGLGIDASRDMLAVARANLERDHLRHCRVRLGDIYRLDVADASVDLVTIHHVLHFLDEPAAAVQEAARVLRGSGRVLIVDLAPHTVESLRSEYAHRRLGLQESEVNTWCQQAGLERVRISRFHGVAEMGEQPLTVCMWSAASA